MSTEIPKIVDGKLQTGALVYKNWKTPLKWQTVGLPLSKNATPEQIVTPNQLLVAIKAAGINPVDILLQKLTPRWIKGSNDKIMGSDFAGVVVKSGSATSFKPGDKIYGNIVDPVGLRGTYSQYALFDVKDAAFCIKIPQGMSFDQAAALPVVTATAFQALKVHKKPLKGANVLILGGGTSVGSNSIQIARNFFDVKNIVATCSSGSFARVGKYGTDTLIDYKKGKTSELNEILETIKTHGKFDIVIDCVRDPVLYSHLEDTLKPASEGGAYVQINGSKSLNYHHVTYLDVLPQWFFFAETIKEKLGFSKFYFYSLLMGKDPEFGPMVEKLWSKKQLEILIDSTYNMKTDFQSGLDKVANCAAKGKVILEL